MTTTSPSEPPLLLGAGVPGRAHLERGTGSQDALRLRRYGYGCIAAAADGVGLHRYAEYGSRAAVQAVHEVFCAYVRGDVNRRCITRTIAARYGTLVKPRYRTQADTTCIFLAHIYKEGLYLGQVGDGICCGFLNGAPFSLGEKEEEFTNLVVPLSASGGGTAPRWRTRFIPREKLRSAELMLATDGVSEDLLPGREAAFARWLLEETADRDRKAGEKKLQTILERWETPLSRDDKTVGLYRYKAAEAAEET